MKQPPYPAPAFTLPDERDTLRSLADYRGQWVIVYFYPKDDTPGCTTEACSLRDARDELADLGAEVFGISKDGAAAHEKFKAKHALNFSLLTDATGETLEAYGAWGKNRFGLVGILRKTFIINPQGVVVKTYGRVTPNGHGQQIIDELQRLQAA